MGIIELIPVVNWVVSLGDQFNLWGSATTDPGWIKISVEFAYSIVVARVLVGPVGRIAVKIAAMTPSTKDDLWVERAIDYIPYILTAATEIILSVSALDKKVGERVKVILDKEKAV